MSHCSTKFAHFKQPQKIQPPRRDAHGSRCIGLRVFSCCLLKSAMLNRKFEQNCSLWSIFGCWDLLKCWLKKQGWTLSGLNLEGWKQVSWSCGDLPMDECFTLFSLMFIFLSYLRGENSTVIHLDILDFSSTSLPLHVSNMRNGDNVCFPKAPHQICLGMPWSLPGRKRFI